MDRRERTEDPLQALLVALNGFGANLWTAMPGIVESFNPEAMTAVVQPAIMGQLRNSLGLWSNAKLPLLLDCPVVMPTGGGFYMSMPLAKGDEGLVVFSARCIDAWWQSGGVQVQQELRMHDLSDGFCIAGVFSQPRVPAGISSSAARLGSIDGTTYIEIATGGVINIVAPAGINITGNLAISGTVTGAEGGAVTGDLNMAGNVTANHGGADQVGLATHLHGGVTAGAGSSAAPTAGT